MCTNELYKHTMGIAMENICYLDLGLLCSDSERRKRIFIQSCALVNTGLDPVDTAKISLHNSYIPVQESLTIGIGQAFELEV